MSCFLPQKPYDCQSDRETQTVADFIALLTCPVWLPVVGVASLCVGTRLKYQQWRHHKRCRELADRLLSHAQTVRIGDGYMYWKCDHTVFVIQVVYEVCPDIGVASIIRESWRKGTNFVLAWVYDIQHVTAKYIRELEATDVPVTERDTIIVKSSCHINIGNMMIRGLADEYYGIIANKFNIVLQTGCDDTCEYKKEKDE